MTYLLGLAIAVGFGLAIAALIGSIIQSRALVAALEGVARQPEAGARLMTVMIIGLAFIESLTIYVLLMSILLWLRLPGADEILAHLR